jgi:CheY-like chemotaxis protein/DNA-binding MarR family transcriptional regulator
MLPTVLIIDDDKAQLDELSELITGFGYRCVSAETGRAGLQLVCEDKAVGIVLVDLHLPDLHGLDILSASVQGEARKLQFVIISGQPALEDAIEGFDRGALTLLTKPIDPRELKQQLLNAVEKLRAAPGTAAQSGEFRERAKKILELSRYRPSRSPSRDTGVPQWDSDQHDGDLNRLLVLADEIANMGRALSKGPVSIKALRLLSEVIRAYVKAESLPVVTLCLAAGMPQTTALRHLDELVQIGLVEKEPDVRDKRRLLVKLSPLAKETLFDTAVKRRNVTGHPAA